MRCTRRRAQNIVGVLGMVVMGMTILMMVVEIGHMMLMASKIADIADAAARAAAQEVIQPVKEQTAAWYLEKAPYRATYRDAGTETAVAAARANGIRDMIGRDLVYGDNIIIDIGSVDASRHCLSTLNATSYFQVGDQKVYHCARVTISVPYQFFVINKILNVGISPGRFEASASAIPVVTHTR